MKRISNIVCKFNIFIVTALIGFLSTTGRTLAAERVSIHQPIVSGAVTIQGVVNTLVQIVFGVGILVTVVFLVLAGIKYIVAGDDVKKIEGARRSIVSSLMGLVVILMAFAIIKFVASILGANAESLFSIIPSTINLNQ